MKISKKTRRPLRPKTKVAMIPGSTRWPLERASLLRKVNAAIRAVADARVEAHQMAMQTINNSKAGWMKEGQQRLLVRLGDDSDFKKHLFRRAAEELGEMLGRGIGDDLRKIDPILQERQRIFDHRMAMAAISHGVDYFAGSDTNAIFSKVALPPLEFYYSTI